MGARLIVGATLGAAVGAVDRVGEADGARVGGLLTVGLSVGAGCSGEKVGQRLVNSDDTSCVNQMIIQQ